MSHVMCQMSGVKVTCRALKKRNFFDKVVGLDPGGSVINGATPSRFVFWWHLKSLKYGLFLVKEKFIFKFNHIFHQLNKRFTWTLGITVK